MFFTRFAFGTLAVTSLVVGCAGSAGTEPSDSSEPTAQTSEALSFRAQCHQRCDAMYDRTIENCFQDGPCVCEATQRHSECSATCDGRHYFPIQCQ